MLRTNRNPKYLWYYAAVLLLVYFFWVYYNDSGISFSGQLSTDYDPDRFLGLRLGDGDGSFGPLRLDKAAKLPFSAISNLYEQSATITKDVHTTLEESVSTLTDAVSAPFHQGDSLETSVISGVPTSLMTTPSYNLSKGHILLERQLPPTA